MLKNVFLPQSVAINFPFSMESLAMNENYSVGIYMYDPVYKAFSIQNNSTDYFKGLIEKENNIVAKILSANKSYEYSSSGKLKEIP